MMMFALPVVAQQTDTLAVRAKERRPGAIGKAPHSPKKATIMSAALPGLGQVYNGRWWKVPIIYGGFAGLTYMAVSNHTDMVRYKDAYLMRIDDDPDTVDEFAGRYSDANLQQLKTTSQRNRDLSFIIMGILYVLNIVDANVDGHLKDFDVSDDLTMQIRPAIQQTMPGQLPAPGIGLSFTLR
ncbi:MAG: hypothetical protein K9J06_07980 [Flavobacteriales bacterium]|nr:hypothetical protein [Flavobacteriales bacterium]